MPKITIFESLAKVLQCGVPDDIMEKALNQNRWFTAQTVNYAVKSICEEMLNRENLSKWVAPYCFNPNVNVGVIMAGNIPLVGFYDLLAVVISGANCYYKASSKDSTLTNWVIQKLKNIDHSCVIEPLKDNTVLNGIIATGSDNANRYFKSQYRNIHSLLRASRTSVAIVDDTTTDDQLLRLWNDVFIYFGLGCRNVSHIFISESFDIDRLRDIWNGKIIDFVKFNNNYRASKAKKMMLGEVFTDGGYYTLSERSMSYGELSDISYSKYSNINEVKVFLEIEDAKIQCVVSDKLSHKRSAYYGNAQSPSLWDFPDSKNVLEFIASLKSE